MKKSTAVVLVISGSLLAGCDNGRNQAYASDPVDSNGNTVTNNTYRTGYGYWHAPYHSWYPYPYNYYTPSFGYYYGGNWSAQPGPEPSYVNYRSSSSSSSGKSTTSWFRSGGSSSSSSSDAHSSTSRGGFGSSGHTSS